MTEESAPVSASASRQKSCNACVKAKRGCDKQHPVCSRCEEKNISCIYAKRTYTESFHSEYDFDSVELDTPWAGLTALSSSINFVDNIPPSPTTSAGLDAMRLPTLDEFINPFVTFTENQTTSPSDMQFINNVGGRLGQQQEEEQALSKFDYAQMADVCVCYPLVKPKKMPPLIFKQDTI
jgi:hypothetical protein